MSMICSLCNSSVEKLIELSNPGKEYKYCCKNCHSIGRLITNNYPFSQSWFKSKFPIDRILIENNKISLNLKDSILFKEEANQKLQYIEKKLFKMILGLIEKVSSLDLIIYLSKVFSEITDLELEHISNNTELTAHLDSMRVDIIYLIQIIIHNGKYRKSDFYMSDNLVINMINLLRQMTYVKSLRDSLYYFEDCKGISIKNGVITLVDENKEKYKFDTNNDIMSDIQIQEAEEIMKEFYSMPFRLDNAFYNELNYTVSDIFNCYMSISNFADHYGSKIFMLTQKEFRMLLMKNLGKEYINKVENIERALLYKKEKNQPEFYKVAHFYAPFFFIPIDNYGVVILNSSIIDFARSSYFNDLTYGVHENLLTNKNLQKEYTRLQKDLITGPFEKKVGELFESLGWKVRINLEGGILVNNKTVAVVPKEVGEIDILAYNPLNNMFIVADCKYIFDYGASAKEIKSYKLKFEGEKKSYTKQIKRKEKWVRENINKIKEVFNCDANIDCSLKAMIITRNNFYHKVNTDVEILSIKTLENQLKADSLM